MGPTSFFSGYFRWWNGRNRTPPPPPPAAAAAATTLFPLSTKIFRMQFEEGSESGSAKWGRLVWWSNRFNNVQKRIWSTTALELQILFRYLCFESSAETLCFTDDISSLWSALVLLLGSSVLQQSNNIVRCAWSSCKSALCNIVINDIGVKRSATAAKRIPGNAWKRLSWATLRNCAAYKTYYSVPAMPAIPFQNTF